MAGSCELNVANADSAYSGEVGYFLPGHVWNSLATSELIRTPPDAMAGNEAADFATVPFHLAFQHMIDLLRISKQENESLTTMLASLRERATTGEQQSSLTAPQRELAQVIETVAQSAQQTTGARTPGWTQQKLERILGLGPATSPSGGFSGTSPTSGFGS
jgi:hypothetical protein